MAATSPASILNRARGALFGQFVGDALGSRYEFKSAAHTKSAIDQDKLGANQNGFLPLLGGGPFKVEKGQVTDDTEMAMALARSMIRKQTFDKEDVAQSYWTWLDSDPCDIGFATANALKLDSGVKTAQMNFYEQISNRARILNCASLSNGCVMRISPLAIASVKWSDEATMQATTADCKLTHPNEQAHVAVICYVLALRELISTGNCGIAFEKAKNYAEQNSPEVSRHLNDAQQQPIPVALPNGKLTNGDESSIGYYGIALQGAFYEMLHTATFEEGLVKTVERGGDTDTNGCICGALLGAKFGAEAIPSSWKDTILNSTFARQQSYSWANASDLETVAEQLLGISQPINEL